MAKKNLTFEDQFATLKEITAQLESGQLPLDESLKLFEKGIALYRTCSLQLESAQRQVTQLIDSQELSIQDLEE